MIGFLTLMSIMADAGPIGAGAPSEHLYRLMYDNDTDIRNQVFSIISCDFHPNTWEKVWLTKLRDKNTSLSGFRQAAYVIGELLIQKIINCMHVDHIEIDTTISKASGYIVREDVEIVSVMRSGDALAEIFIRYFTHAPVSKYLIQRDPETHKPEYLYKKMSKTIAKNKTVVICEPMVATGMTLTLVLDHLKQIGVDESNIIIASVVCSPEAVDYLSRKYPRIHLVMIAMDQRINDQKYIVPGLGDFGDRFYGTE